MNLNAELEITLRRALGILEGLPVRFHCTGGLASSLYGEPRFTQDIDIVISLEDSEKTAPELIAALSSKFLIDPDQAKRAIARNDMFQALDTETYIKIDFHVGEAIPGELTRSVRKELLSCLVAPTVSKEDAILSKLLWIKKGSEKSRQDVVMMLRGAGVIDWEHLIQRAKDLGVADLLMELNKQQ